MLTIRKKLDGILGKACATVLPIKFRTFAGSGEKIAVCTLSSIWLLHQISSSKQMMQMILIVGRLLSENKGIDEIIKFASCHSTLEYVILCGKDVKGHQSGQALVSLYQNGTDGDRIIIGAKGRYPILMSSKEDIESFRCQIKIIDMIGITDLAKIILRLSALDRV